MAVGECGILLLEMAAVGQQDPAEIGRRLRATRLASEAVAHQGRQVAGVIQMGMGQDDAVDTGRQDGKGCPVPEAELLQPLEQAAIHEEARRVERQEMA